jgi:hypothetical protein
VEPVEPRWSPVEPLSDEAATEGGTVVADETHAYGARITLEQGENGGFAITCGIYGWMMHTRYFAGECEARQAFDDMKRDLDAIILEIPLKDDPDLDGKMDHVSAEIGRFVDRYPA